MRRLNLQFLCGRPYWGAFEGNKGNIIIKGLGYSTHKVYVRSLINGNEAYITSGDFMNRHRSSEDRICIENNILYYREYFDDYDAS